MLPFILQASLWNQAELDFGSAHVFALKAFCHRCWSPAARVPRFWSRWPASLPVLPKMVYCSPGSQTLSLPFHAGEEAFLGGFFVQVCVWFWVGRFYCILSSVYGRQYRDLENLLPCHSSSPESPRWSAFFFAPFRVFLCVYGVMSRVFWL